MKKIKIIEEVNFHRHNEVALEDCIQKLQEEIREIRGELNMRRERNSRDRFMEREVETEKSLAEEEQ